MSIAGLVASAAERWPTRPALRDAHSSRELTFASLANAVFAVGPELERSGLTVGDRVALIGDARLDYLVADYGVMAAGFVRVPLDPALSPTELASQIRDAEARVVVCSASRLALGAEAAREAGLPLVTLEDVVANACADTTARRPMPAPFDALASLNYTGGTSSEPKAVMIAQGTLRAAVQNIVMGRAIAPGDVMLNVRPLWPIAAIIVLAHLAAGGTVVTAEGFKPEQFVSLVESSGASYTSLVPTHLVRLLRDADRDALARLRTLRAIDVGAAAIPPETFAELVDAIGPRIGVLYGLTEAPWSCYQPPADLLNEDGSVDPTRMRSAGRPLFGCDLAIDAEGRRAAPGEEGEILLRGAHVMRGYWKRPDLSAEALRDGWLHTGDRGSVDAAGRLSVTGRIKEVIRSGGKSVIPAEVEQVLCSHPAIAEAAVLGLPDREWGEIVAAAVVLHAGSSIDEAALVAHCASALSSHKRPRVIRFVEALPRSHYGKVQKAKLKELFAAS